MKTLLRVLTVLALLVGAASAQNLYFQDAIGIPLTTLSFKVAPNSDPSAFTKTVYVGTSSAEVVSFTAGMAGGGSTSPSVAYVLAGFRQGVSITIDPVVFTLGHSPVVLSAIFSSGGSAYYLPVVVDVVNPGVPVDPPAVTPSSGTVIVPHVVVGNGWDTTITCVNEKNVPVEVAVQFYTDDQTPFPTVYGFGHAHYWIAAGDVFRLRSINRGEFVQGYAVVTADITKMPTVMVSYEGKFGSTSMVPVQPAKAEMIPFVTTLGRTTGIGLVNLASMAENIGIAFYSVEGNLLAAGSIPLAAGQHTAFNPATVFPTIKGFNGFARIVNPGTNAKVAVMGLYVDSVGVATLPPSVQ